MIDAFVNVSPVTTISKTYSSGVHFIDLDLVGLNWRTVSGYDRAKGVEYTAHQLATTLVIIEVAGKSESVSWESFWPVARPASF